MDKHTHPRVRGGSVFTADYRPLNRNDIARILFCAEAMDRRTHQPGQHGGVIGRSGLAVLRALAVCFLNKRTGRLDPSLAALAKAANLARSTVQEAVKRLQAAGIVEKVRRMTRKRVRVWQESTCRYVTKNQVRQITNAYRLNVSQPG